MHYTKLISEEHFTAGLPLVIVLPVAEEGTTNEEVEYLIEELHKSSRWPILVFSVGYKPKENIYTEINQDGSYIILTSGPCVDWENYIRSFLQELYVLSSGNNREHSWNPRANFVVSVMSNCTKFHNKNLSRAILEHLWNFDVMNATVLFQKYKKHTGNDLQKNTTDSAQGRYLEMHTWYPYENSERCNPDEDTVPVKMFTVRNLSDVRRSEIYR
jgi:hypothetical protein